MDMGKRYFKYLLKMSKKNIVVIPPMKKVKYCAWTLTKGKAIMHKVNKGKVLEYRKAPLVSLPIENHPFGAKDYFERFQEVRAPAS